MEDEKIKQQQKSTDVLMIVLHLLTVILIIAYFVLLRNYIDTKAQIDDLNAKLDLFIAEQQDHNELTSDMLVNTNYYLGRFYEEKTASVETPGSDFNQQEIEILEEINNDLLSSVVSIYAGDRLGSGFVISAKGHILTTYDTIKDISRIEVDFFDGTITIASVIRYDEEKNMAVLRVIGKRLPYLNIKGSSDIFVDQEIKLLHHPLGYSISVSDGTIKKLDYTQFEFDAAANMGSIGGPVLDGDNKVIGMINSENSATYSNDILPLLIGLT